MTTIFKPKQISSNENIKKDDIVEEQLKKIEEIKIPLKVCFLKLQNIQKDIETSENLSNINNLLIQFEKENNQLNRLEAALAKLNFESLELDKLKEQNKQFLEKYDPAKIERKLSKMKTQLSDKSKELDKRIRISSQNSSNRKRSIQMIDMSSPLLKNQYFLAHSTDQYRKELLAQELKQIIEIERLIFRIKGVCLNCQEMILEQGLKLKLAVGNLKKAKQKLAQGKKELAQANIYQEDTNKKMFMFCMLIVAVVLVILLITSASYKRS